MSVHSPRSREELMLSSVGFEYVLFWGPGETDPAKKCLNQWYRAPFKSGSQVYPTAEHYMMAQKAELFGDMETRDKILASISPKVAKDLGRLVRGFDEKIWVEHATPIVVRGNLLKFGQNADIKAHLLATKGKILVEASPVDRVWGTGLAADHPDATNVLKWKGKNRLGFALMEARDLLEAA